MSIELRFAHQQTKLMRRYLGAVEVFFFKIILDTIIPFLSQSFVFVHKHLQIKSTNQPCTYFLAGTMRALALLLLPPALPLLPPPASPVWQLLQSTRLHQLEPLSHISPTPPVSLALPPPELIIRLPTPPTLQNTTSPLQF